MDTEQRPANSSAFQSVNVEIDSSRLATDSAPSSTSTSFVPTWMNAGRFPNHSDGRNNELTLAISELLHPHCRIRSAVSPMSLTNFVEQKFIPDYVAHRRCAGRAHFHGILKHILTPKFVDRAVGSRVERTSVKPKATTDWPYLDSLRLDEVTPERIQQLVSAAIRSGYSTQTAAHIRNVAFTLFGYALKCGDFVGMNPATGVVLPAISRKKAHTLTLTQLKQVMDRMRYPEREIALFVTSTNMSVAEVCGLRWKYLNSSAEGHLVDGYRIPPRTIAVWNQNYRGEFGPVLEKRKRFLSIPEILYPTLYELRHRQRFTTPEDFVLASRTGTPISPDNIAARHLKSIGRLLEMPWLSWNVFHRTQMALKTTCGLRWLKDLERILPLNSGPTGSSRSRS